MEQMAEESKTQGLGNKRTRQAGQGQREVLINPRPESMGLQCEHMHQQGFRGRLDGHSAVRSTVAFLEIPKLLASRKGDDQQPRASTSSAQWKEWGCACLCCDCFVLVLFSCFPSLVLDSPGSRASSPTWNGLLPRGDNVRPKYPWQPGTKCEAGLC